jgi:serine/threonine protein kinase
MYNYVRAYDNTPSQRLSEELLVWQLVLHPHLVPSLGVLRPSDPEDSIYLVSVWMENGRLTDFINDNPSEDPLIYVSIPTQAPASNLLIVSPAAARYKWPPLHPQPRPSTR